MGGSDVKDDDFAIGMFGAFLAGGALLWLVLRWLT
jgi:hypothetical protein